MEMEVWKWKYPITMIFSAKLSLDVSALSAFPSDDARVTVCVRGRLETLPAKHKNNRGEDGFCLLCLLFVLCC